MRRPDSKDTALALLDATTPRPRDTDAPGSDPDTPTERLLIVAAWSADTAAAASAATEAIGSPLTGRPVFVDSSGRRMRCLKVSVTVVGVGLVMYLALLIMAVTAGTVSPNSSSPFAATIADMTGGSPSTAHEAAGSTAATTTAETGATTSTSGNSATTTGAAADTVAPAATDAAAPTTTAVPSTTTATGATTTAATSSTDPATTSASAVPEGSTDATSTTTPEATTTAAPTTTTAPPTTAGATTAGTQR